LIVSLRTPPKPASSEITIESVPVTEGAVVELLGSAGNLTWSADSGNLTLTLPADLPDAQAYAINPLFSPRGEAKCVRGASVRGARRLTSAGVLSQSVEHGEQAQRSTDAPIACFGGQAVRKAG
jgi:hypothetical protein